MQHPLVVGGIFAVAVTVLVLLNTPKSYSQEERRSMVKTVFKTFVMSFVVCGVIAYVLQDNESNNMMTNIIKGDPDF